MIERAVVYDTINKVYFVGKGSKKDNTNINSAKILSISGATLSAISMNKTGSWRNEVFNYPKVNWIVIPVEITIKPIQE